MVRLTDTDTNVLDWLNGDIQTLRENYERVRAKPVPRDAAWLQVGDVGVLRFAADPMWHPLLPLGRSAEHSEAMRGSQPLALHLREPLIPRRDMLRLRPSATFSPRGEAEGRTVGEDEPGATAIVYFHGGGFIVGSPLTHADIAMELAGHTGLPIYSVDYRLAPDHPAPAPAEDGISVIRHLVDGGFGHILLCGDSAGGAIALSVEATLPDDLRQHIIGVASFYGAHGLLDTSSLIEKGSREDGTDSACVARYFLAAGGEAYSIKALARPSPVPVYLIAADDDPLRDDTLILARAMKDHGRAVTSDIVVGENHGFLHHQPHYARAEAALQRFAGWVEGLTGN